MRVATVQGAQIIRRDARGPIRWLVLVGHRTYDVERGVDGAVVRLPGRGDHERQPVRHLQHVQHRGGGQRASVMRFPLTTLANAGTLIFNHWSTTNNGSLRLTQGAGSTMYWGSHNSSNQLRLFSWVDGQNSVNFWNVGVGQWSAPSGSTAPNGVNWLARDSRITGAAVGSGRIVD